MSRQLGEVAKTKISAGPSRITGPAELIEMVQYLDRNNYAHNLFIHLPPCQILQDFNVILGLRLFGLVPCLDLLLNIHVLSPFFFFFSSQILIPSGQSPMSDLTSQKTT
jgi:hypothetical protein